MSSIPRQAAEYLESNGQQVAGHQGIVGLDGFVDQIVRVLDRIDSDGNEKIFADIGSLAERIQRAAGKSTALELVVQQVKLGGNGPIMANALAHLGLDLTYIGSVGQDGHVHPVFRPMEEICRVIPVSKVAQTDALEFNDGKLMFQQMRCLDDMTYGAITAAVGEEHLLELFEEADFVALDHWASLPHMSDIWRRLQEDICPQLSDRRRQIFFDLADLEKRSHEDILEALTLITKFGKWYYTMLGMNLKESETICQVLGIDVDADTEEELVRQRCEEVRRRLDLGCVAIHPLACAGAADANGSAVVAGPFIPNPKISTGAGDHFNSGFCLGRILGADLVTSLQCGVGASGFYVRTAISPSIAELTQFLNELANE